MSTWNSLRDAGKLASTKMNYIVGSYQRIDGLHSNTPQGTYVHKSISLLDLYRIYSYNFIMISVQNLL